MANKACKKAHKREDPMVYLEITPKIGPANLHIYQAA